jgi:hypothetical protein
LTCLIGGGITYYYQERRSGTSKRRRTWRQPEIPRSRLREVGDILEQRRASSLRCLNAIRDHAPPQEIEQLWQDYLKTVDACNTKWNLYRALVLEEFGPDMQKRFYDEQATPKEYGQSLPVPRN